MVLNFFSLQPNFVLLVKTQRIVVLISLYTYNLYFEYIYKMNTTLKIRYSVAEMDDIFKGKFVLIS